MSRQIGTWENPLLSYTKGKPHYFTVCKGPVTLPATTLSEILWIHLLKQGILFDFLQGHALVHIFSFGNSLQYCDDALNYISSEV